jgi:hypothetical protein
MQMDEGVQSLAGGREWPVGDHIKFRFGKAIAVAGSVMANVFDTLFEEVTFAELERETALLADLEAALKTIQQFGFVDGVQQDVVNDDTIASVL